MTDSRRVHVVGTTGTGKTTLASRIADALGVPHVELDALHWLPDWTPEDSAVLEAKVREVAAGPAWVVDGNYSLVQPILWDRADTVVWLDYPFPRMFGRLFARTIGRVVMRRAIWNGNRESLRSVFSRDSIFWWQAKTYRKNRRRYPQRFADPRWAHLATVRLRSPAAAERWLAALPGGGSTPPGRALT